MVELWVKREALLSALQASRHTYPDEFIGLFRGRREGERILVEELLVTPLANYERDWSAFNEWLVPLNMSAVASFHSHPDSVPRPSRQDLHFFARGPRFHFIAASPYSPRNVRAYDNKGKPVAFTLV